MGWLFWRNLTVRRMNRRGLPPVFARSERIWRNVVALGALGSVLVSALFFHNDRVWWPLTGVVCAVMGTAIWMHLSVERRFRRAVVETGGLMCPQCGFDLRGCVSGRCPECGTQFEAEEVVRQWRVAFGDWEYDA